MAENQSLVDKFNAFVTQDTKGAEIGIYAVSGALFAFAYYKIRPITKFGKASDIPKHFIKNKLQQQGAVLAVEPHLSAGPLLRVNHKPPLNFLALSKKSLPVKLCGIQINANGFAWLQSVAVNRKIEFVPLKEANDIAECRVILVKHGQNNRNLDLTECLTRLGFAQVVDTPSKYKDKELQRYIAKLQKIQSKAKKNRAGSWSQSLPPPSWPIKLIDNLITKIKFSILPVRYRLPELVR